MLIVRSNMMKRQTSSALSSKTESAQKSIMGQHEKFGKTIGVNGCFGSSNLRQMTGFISRKIVIDGCKERCLKKTLEKAGAKIDLSYALDEDFGLEKKKSPDFSEEDMSCVSATIKDDIEKIEKK
ncbi:MAG: hypothetical protein J7L54_03370 [Elusimicrobia bacterium]|nr:hypothetical protein [Elusimicrobiota bacterium]